MAGNTCNGSATDTVAGIAGGTLLQTNGIAAAPPHANGHNGHKGHTTPTASSAPAPRYRFPDICYTLRSKVLAFLDADIPTSNALLRGMQSQVRISVDVIEQALRRYSLDQISLSYNGGKDCLVLLILILACLPMCNEIGSIPDDAPVSAPDSAPNGATDDDASVSASAAPRAAAATAEKTAAIQPRCPVVPPSAAAIAATATSTSTSTTTSRADSPPPRRFQAIYIVPPDPFPEVDAFVDESTAAYYLDLARCALPMRPALDTYLAEHPSVRAIFMGTRRTDPHGEFLDHFTPTDAGWPQFMRIHAVIDWHYAEIWAFIRYFDIPFCNLYNQGFTSLGGMTDTRPNPALAKQVAGGDANGAAPAFRPAYELMDDDSERLGRGR